MKRLLTYIVIASSLVACVREETFISEGVDEMIILNAQIDASQTTHYAYLGVSDASVVRRLEGAVLTCYVNDEVVSEAEEQENKMGEKIQVLYKFEAELKPGDRVRLEAEADGAKVYAEVVVPDTTGRMVKVDTTTFGAEMHFNVTVRNEAEDRGFYRLRLRMRSFVAYYYEGAWSRWYESIGEKKLSHKNDPILDARLGSSDGDEFFGFGIDSNHYCLFSDKRFSDRVARIDVSIPLQELNLVATDQYYDMLMIVQEAQLAVLSMDREEYDYLSILNILLEDDYDIEGMLEPVSILSNVVGGTGFVGIFIPSTIEVRLPDRWVQW